jgi:hypothetical protein
MGDHEAEEGLGSDSIRSPRPQQAASRVHGGLEVHLWWNKNRRFTLFLQGGLSNSTQDLQ